MIRIGIELPSINYTSKNLKFCFSQLDEVPCAVLEVPPQMGKDAGGID